MRLLIDTVPESRTKKHVAGSPSAYTVDPAANCSTTPLPVNHSSCASVRDSNRNSVRSSSGERVVICDPYSLGFQVRVDQGDGHRALPDRGRDPLHRLRAYVAGGEDPGDARFE